MVQLSSTVMGVDTDQEQALAFVHRGRSRSHRDIMTGLSRTATTAVGTSSIDLTTRFPDLARPITFTTKIKLQQGNASAPSGDLFTLGNTSLSVAAGVLTLTVAGSVVGTASPGGLGDTSITDEYHSYDIALSINPGAGKSRLWVNGDLVIRDNGVALAGWASGTTFEIGTALVDCDMIIPFSAFNGQMPRFFD